MKDRHEEDGSGWAGLYGGMDEHARCDQEIDGLRLALKESEAIERGARDVASTMILAFSYRGVMHGEKMYAAEVSETLLKEWRALLAKIDARHGAG